MAFAIAIGLALIAAVIGGLGFIADGMSDAPGQTSGVAPIVIGLLVLAVLVAASHWLPRIGW